MYGLANLQQPLCTEMYIKSRPSTRDNTAPSPASAPRTHLLSTGLGITELVTLTAQHYARKELAPSNITTDQLNIEDI